MDHPAARPVQGTAFHLDAPTSADALKALLADVPTLDIDAGPARVKIYAHGSGGIRVKELTQPLKEACHRLRKAGYLARVQRRHDRPAFVEAWYK